MNIAIVTNVYGRGLAKDARLLKELLESFNHTVSIVQFDEPNEEPADLYIFLEVVVRSFVHLSTNPPWLFVNPEFLKPEYLSIIKSSFGKVLCKTNEAHSVCKVLFGDKAVYTGFLADDKFNPTIPRELRCLHVAGQSKVKGTQAVVDAWKWKYHGEGLNVPLTVVADWEIKEIPAGVTLLSKITDEELVDLQNRCIIHLQPSESEGFGHVLREAMSVNAMILTTAAPPMDEIKSCYHVPFVSKTSFNQAFMYEVSPLDIYTAVKEMLILYEKDFSDDGVRDIFLKENAEFRNKMMVMLEEFKPAELSCIAVRQPHELRIAFLGNFGASESTENMVKWALEELDHEVECIQENTATLKKIQMACSTSDLFLWVRTPGWLKVEDELMLAWLKNPRIKTMSLHLDKFWGIPEREALIGVHPFWKTDSVWTADGSRAADFEARGVRHYWMRPAVSEVYCHPGIPQDQYRCDVGFVGAKDYHAEYPFRKKMVEFLEETYRGRFRHITGIRGHELNNVYASMKVVVGDCIFAGTPMYWSDRLPETLGRSGFLLHPKVEGLQWYPAGHYKPQNLESLHEQIEYWLAHPKERKGVQWYGADHVRKHDTWTIRMHEILETIFK